MKKVRILIGLFVFAFAIVLVSCTKDSTVIQSDITETNNVKTTRSSGSLHEDPAFHHYVMLRYRQLDQMAGQSIHDIAENDAVNAILNGCNDDNLLSLQQKTDLAALFGYEDCAAYEADMQDLTNTLNSLEAQYNVSAMSHADIESQMNLYDPNDFGEILAAPCTTCACQRNDCREIVIGQEIVALTGCVALAPAAPAALICIAGVAIWVNSSMNACETSFVACNGGSSAPPPNNYDHLEYDIVNDVNYNLYFN